jgi:lipoate-protein ligase A
MRFIPFANFTASTNMAIDEAILQTHVQGFAPPTLRLYGFAPPAVSFGHGQRVSPKVIGSFESKGFAVVRRPSGGRAVLHFHDLTYSFICSSKSEPGGLVNHSVKRAYHEICLGLINALAELGAEVEMGESESNHRQTQDCFAVTTGADLHHRGRKIIGSAQLRRKNAVLQHGSLILNQPQGLMAELLGGASNENVIRHANLWDLLGQEVPMQKLENAFMRGFEKAFNLRGQVSGLTKAELDLAKQLEEKYLLTSS